MKELQIFNNQEFGLIRSVMINDEPWFVAKDIAIALGYTNPRKAIIDHINDEDKRDGVTIRDSIGREQKPVFINESGVYSLIFSSQLPTAKRFKHWVTSEVLPAIRKTGSYNISKVPPVKNIRDVVKYIEVVRDSAKENGATPQEVTEIINSISGQFGIQLPECFNREITFHEWLGQVDFVFSCYRGKGCRLPTFEDWIASKTIKTNNMIKG